MRQQARNESSPILPIPEGHLGYFCFGKTTPNTRPAAVIDCAPPPQGFWRASKDHEIVVDESRGVDYCEINEVSLEGRQLRARFGLGRRVTPSSTVSLTFYFHTWHSKPRGW